MMKEPEQEKCKCACHDNRLKVFTPSGMEHDTKCCENMNGLLATPLPKEEESLSILTDIYEREGLLGIQKYISTVLSSQRTKILQEVVESLEGEKKISMPKLNIKHTENDLGFNAGIARAIDLLTTKTK